MKTHHRGCAAATAFLKQLPRVFTYPHFDALVKIFAFAIAVFVAETFLPLGYLFGRLIWLAFLAYCSASSSARRAGTSPPPKSS